MESKIIIRQIDKAEFNKRNIDKWPVWEKEESEFPWVYQDFDEECYILDGEAHIRTIEGNYTIKAGDFVTFKKGLECDWKITKPIRKHYNFV
jgi:uncharacterized cupin superfamily protein